MKKKEIGALYGVCCRGCGWTILVGWRGHGRKLEPVGSGPIAPASADLQGMQLGPLACACGKTTLRIDPVTTRAVAEWAPELDEPDLRGHILFGSPRDQVAAPRT